MRSVIRINETIRASQVRVIDHDGAMLGVLPFAEALQRAKRSGRHLVEVNALASPPICKIMAWTHAPGPPDAIIVRRRSGPTRGD